MNMQYEELQSPRFRIEQAAGREDIVVPAARNWFILLFLCFWLCIWTFGGLSAWTMFLKTRQPFLAFWLCAWTLGECYALLTVAWMLAGAEILRVVNSDLQVGYRIFGFERSKLYRGSEIRNLSPQSVAFWDRYRGIQMPIVSLSNRVGCVKFDYGARTIYLGAALDEAEGREIISFLAKRLPKTAMAQSQNV